MIDPLRGGFPIGLDPNGTVDLDLNSALELEGEVAGIITVMIQDSSERKWICVFLMVSCCYCSLSSRFCVCLFV